jgi:hypothetical protein
MGQTQSAEPTTGSPALTTPATPASSSGARFTAATDDRAPLKTTWDRIKLRLRTGDLVLFKSARPSPISGAEPWSSAAVVIKLNQENRLVTMTPSQRLVPPASLLGHAESGKIGLVDIEAKVFAMVAPGEAQYSEVCVLRLKNFRLEAEQAEELGTWLKSVAVSGSRMLHDGVPAAMAERLAQSHEPLVDASDIFATQLAANCYRAMGLLSQKTSSTNTLESYLPASSLENAKLDFHEPIVVGTGDWNDARRRSWKRTLKEHGDWGRHSAHELTLRNQLKKGIAIPPNPRESLSIAMEMLSEAAVVESKGAGQKRQEEKRNAAAATAKLREKAVATLEIALMNELYYGTGSPQDQKRIADIKEALANNKVQGHEGLSGGILDQRSNNNKASESPPAESV